MFTKTAEMNQNDTHNELILEDQDLSADQCKVYKRRWLVLIIFCFYAIANLISYYFYSVITHILMSYYGISSISAQWTLMIYTVTYLVTALPGSYMIDRLGLRWVVLIGITGTCVGSWIKVFSVNPSRFWVLLLGQGISATFQVCVNPLPAKLAAVWFGSNEVSKACGIAFIGIQIAYILSFILPALLVSDNSIEEIEYGLSLLAYIVAIYSTVMLPIVFLFFSNAPPTVPTLAQQIVQDNNNKTFVKTLKDLIKNRSFMVFLVIFGMAFGVANAFTIMLNQLIIRYHPNAGKHAGFLPASAMVWGLAGSYTFAAILDKYRNYKPVTIILMIVHAILLVLYNSTLSLSLYFVYAIGWIQTFVSMGVYLTAIELCIELTYPSPQAIPSGMLIGVYQIFALMFTYLYTYLLGQLPDIQANIVLYSIILASNFLFLFVKFDLRRQNVESKIKLKQNDVKAI